MLEAAVGDDPRFEVSDLELHRRGPSYTVDTLRELGGRYPDAELYFILGVDQYLGFPAWRAPEEIVRHARLLVMTRDGERSEERRVGKEGRAGGGPRRCTTETRS